MMGEMIVQDQTTVVFCHTRSEAQGKVLLYALRSWLKNARFPLNIVVIGDREEWFSKEVTVIEHPSTGKGDAADLAARLQLAIGAEEVTETFILAPTSLYVVNPVSLAHIGLPKVIGRCDNYETRTPVLLCKAALKALLEEHPELAEGKAPLVSAYFAADAHCAHPVWLDWRTDQLLLPVVSRAPDKGRMRQLLQRKVFMTNSPTGYSATLLEVLEELFPDSSEFEASEAEAAENDNPGG